VKKLDLDNFSLFSKLPNELRVIIWKKALPKSRVVRLVRYAVPPSPNENGENNAISNPQQLLKSTHSTPTLFRCSHESREVAMSQYQVWYEGRADMKPFYFNSKRDTIFVESVGALSLLMNGDCKKVNGISEFTHEHVQSLMLAGDLGTLKSLAFALLEQYKKLDNLKLQNQRAAAQSDMGPIWHNKIRRVLKRQNPRALVDFMAWSNMVNELEESERQEQ
jgi:2EXR family